MIGDLVEVVHLEDEVAPEEEGGGEVVMKTITTDGEVNTVVIATVNGIVEETFVMMMIMDIGPLLALSSDILRCFLEQRIQLFFLRSGRSMKVNWPK